MEQLMTGASRDVASPWKQVKLTGQRGALKPRSHRRTHDRLDGTWPRDFVTRVLDFIWGERCKLKSRSFCSTF